MSILAGIQAGRSIAIKLMENGCVVRKKQKKKAKQAPRRKRKADEPPAQRVRAVRRVSIRQADPSYRRSPLELLPSDILLVVLEFLFPVAIANLSSCSRRLLNDVQNSAYWRRVI